MDRPTALPVLVENIPLALRDLPQWVVWKFHYHKKRKVWIKLPLNPDTRAPASTTDRDTWSPYAVVQRAYEVGGYDGLGFVFSASDDLIGVDMDKCLSDGLSPLAEEILSAVPGYVEKSPSGTGLHIITRGTLARAYKNDKHGLEVYTQGRYFTITGQPYAP